MVPVHSTTRQGLPMRRHIALFLRRSPSYGPRPCDVTPPIIQWIPPLIHWDLSNLDQRGGDSASTGPSGELRPVVAVVETGASTDSQVSAVALPASLISTQIQAWKSPCLAIPFGLLNSLPLWLGMVRLCDCWRLRTEYQLN